VRFNDDRARPELLAMLEPFTVVAPAGGVLQSSLSSGAQISRGALLGRVVEDSNQILEMRSPLIGKVDQLLVTNGARLKTGDGVLTIKSDQQSIWEALRGLALIGKQEDLPLIERYATAAEPTSDRLKQQAAQTANAIKSRPK